MVVYYTHPDHFNGANDDQRRRPPMFMGDCGSPSCGLCAAEREIQNRNQPPWQRYDPRTVYNQWEAGLNPTTAPQRVVPDYQYVRPQDMQPMRFETVSVDESATLTAEAMDVLLRRMARPSGREENVPSSPDPFGNRAKLKKMKERQAAEIIKARKEATKIPDELEEPKYDPFEDQQAP